MRRRLPPAPVELPAWVRVFEPDRWTRPDDPTDPEQAEWAARRRWGDARYEWGDENGLSPLDIIRRCRHDRRAGLG